jgi:hypothetical protein
VAADADGDFVVLWDSLGSHDGSALGVFAQRFSSSGTPLSAEFQVSTFTTGDQRAGGVAASDDGDFVAVWASRSQDGEGYGIFGRRFASDGTALAAEFQVNSYTSSYQSDPSLAAGADGSFVVAWRSYTQDGSADGVFAQRFGSSGAPAGGEFQVNAYTAGYQRAPSLAIDPSGELVIVWHSESAHDGSGHGAFGRRVSSLGVPLAVEFQINSYTTGNQYEVVAAADTDGDFVVSWTSQTQDGAEVGIFAQRFTEGIALDVDGNGSTDALTDGLLVLRFLFDFTGATLTTSAVGQGCVRCDATAIEAYLNALGLALDIDGNTTTDALTDGLLVLRYLFDFTGDVLTGGAVGQGCSRCDATTIEPYLSSLDS